MNKLLRIGIAALIALALATALSAHTSPSHTHVYDGDYHWISSVTQPDQSIRVYLEDPELPRIIVSCPAGSVIAIAHTNDSTSVTCK